ncbi:MAG: nitrous oxide reductase family maturation protein NosD [Promethearchaeota archaeon]
METRKKSVLTILMLFVIMFSISIQNNIKNCGETGQKDLKSRVFNLKSAGYWNNFTFIHITNINWTIANQSDWCSGSGTWSDPFLIENMIINATNSPIGSGIFIENSKNIHFEIINVTIFGSTYGIKLENTNNGTIINSILSDNIGSGISMKNCVNNTILRNKLINNGVYGINLTSKCNNNKILENTIKNDGTNLQDTGIYLGSYCDDNDIMGNWIYDNSVYGINIENYCEGTLIYNNIIKNIATSQQDYGIRLHNDCHQSTISLNIIENINLYGIYIVTSDQNSITDNQIIDCSYGMYMLIDLQSIITGNNISRGSYGIIMSACDGSEIAYNSINETVNYAIRIFINSDNNEIHDNTIKDNTNIGIQLDDPSDINNKFYKNSFISNGIHAYDNGTATSWNNSKIGNYWDDYQGKDLDDDGIGDIHYNITGSAASMDYYPIWDDGDSIPPIITIISPSNYSCYSNPPTVQAVFYDLNGINKTWYWVVGSSDNETFTGASVEIDVAKWFAQSDGLVTIIFFANDSSGNLNSEIIVINKDTTLPVIIVNSPGSGTEFGKEAPVFNLTVSDLNLEQIWYTINNSGVKYYITKNGTIDQDAWDALNDGNVIITFYARDIAWNNGSITINLIKDTSQIPGYGPPSLDLITIIIIVSLIVILVIVTAGIVMRKLSIKGKLTKSREFSEDQLSKAQYFKDITSILTILAIHEESGLCLSKIALHGGIGLDENLFTGFISAIGSFKNELAKQMGLQVRGEGGDNTIAYNEFTITLMDGEFLRLGLVSYQSLGDLIKAQCEQILRAYEIKHVNDLKNFDGDLQIFNDFEETIEKGLDINLNKKCIINVKQLNNFDGPESFITILNDLKSRSEGFYPAEIALTLIRELNISDQEANFMIYEAYKNQVFLPIK